MLLSEAGIGLCHSAGVGRSGPLGWLPSGLTVACRGFVSIASSVLILRKPESEGFKTGRARMAWTLKASAGTRVCAPGEYAASGRYFRATPADLNASADR